MHSAKEAYDRTFVNPEFDAVMVANHLYAIDRNIKLAFINGQRKITFIPSVNFNYDEEAFIEEFLRSYGYEVKSIEKSFNSDNEDELEDLYCYEISWECPNTVREFDYSVGENASNGKWLMEVKDILRLFEELNNKTKKQ